MKAYGVRRKDHGCCPGHDKYPAERYNWMHGPAFRRKERARKKAERARIRRLVALIQSDEIYLGL